MRLLVGGCSLSSGWGFTSDNIDQTWPNLLSKKLDAQLTNVSKAGYDNTGIFLNLMEQLTSTDSVLVSSYCHEQNSHKSKCMGV